MKRFIMIVCCLTGLLLCPLQSSADLFGYFRQLDAGKTTDPIAYSGVYDTYLYEVVSTNLTYDALQLSFTSSTGSFLNTGLNQTFRNSATNPVFFGIEAPDTFFIIPPGSEPLAATQTDNSHTLSADYTTQGAVPLVQNNFLAIPVAFFSVPAGTTPGTNSDQFWGGAVGGSQSDFPPHVSARTVSAPSGALLSETLQGVSLAGYDLAWTGFTFAGPNPVNQPTFDYNTHEFNWDSTGSAPGTYVASVKVKDIIPSNFPTVLPSYATFTIQIVPEPTSLMFAISGATICGILARRRSFCTR